jgi:cold shock CspA family protein
MTNDSRLDVRVPAQQRAELQRLAKETGVTVPWPMQQVGTVKWFRQDRGYGFISSYGREFFVHAKDCHPREPVEGDKVKFVVGTSKDGRVAARSVTDCLMPPSNADFEDFARSHQMCAAISHATADFLNEICNGDLFGPPLPFVPLEKLRLAVQQAYKEYVAAPAPSPPHLTLVQ